jgi:twitching motility protein PilT
MSSSTQLTTLIQWAREKGASDLHLEPGSSPYFRLRGELQKTPHAPLKPTDTREWLETILTQNQQEDYWSRKSIDCSKTLAGCRVRIHAHQSIKGTCFSIRLLSSFKSNLHDCNLLPELKTYLSRPSGLILVTGSTGSGKSTTLAALVEEINHTKHKNIVTLEQPIEYHFQNDLSLIRQREIGTHCPSFELGILDSLREDPDVLLIGELREPEVIRLALHASETGHLVLATLHSATCVEALSRMLLSFAPELQASVRAQLADALVAVICQKLVPVPGHGILAPQCEILTASAAVRAAIRSNQMSQIFSMIQTGAAEGMWTFDRYSRWMEQKQDWVRPQRGAPILPPSEPTPPSDQGPLRPRALVTSAALASNLPSTGSPASVIEISEEEADLNELARKIAQDPKKSKD